MFRFLVPLSVILSTATSIRDLIPTHGISIGPTSAASEAQIKFAIENKYDDTGPGAKEPQYAYNTYKTLEDALVAYLDDPDTKLPEHERAKAINKLTQSTTLPHYTQNLGFHKWNINPLNRDVKISKLQFRPNLNGDFHYPATKIFYPEVQKTDIKAIDGNDLKLGHYLGEQKLEPFKFQKIHTVKGSPLSLAHYTRDPDLNVAHEQFNAYPKYTFSYGVHDKSTGDSKQAQESRDGGTVRGYYSFIDADGKTRTVHYTADDRQGFRATVQKSV